MRRNGEELRTGEGAADLNPSEVSIGPAPE